MQCFSACLVMYLHFWPVPGMGSDYLRLRPHRNASLHKFVWGEVGKLASHSLMVSTHISPPIAHVLVQRLRPRPKFLHSVVYDGAHKFFGRDFHAEGSRGMMHVPNQARWVNVVFLPRSLWKRSSFLMFSTVAWVLGNVARQAVQLTTAQPAKLGNPPPPCCGGNVATSQRPTLR